MPNHSEYIQQNGPEKSDPRVMVQSEDPPDRILLETKIVKGEEFQKQQGILDRRMILTARANDVSHRNTHSMDRAG